MSVRSLQPPFRPHVRQHLQALFEPRAAERRDRRPVGLVERRLEDDLRAEAAVDRHQAFGHRIQQFGRFNDTGSGNEFHSFSG